MFVHSILSRAHIEKHTHATGKIHKNICAVWIKCGSFYADFIEMAAAKQCCLAAAIYTKYPEF